MHARPYPSRDDAHARVIGAAPLASPPSPALAIARLRVQAADVRDANDVGTPRRTYALCLLSCLDMLDVSYTNGHSALIGELWKSARQCAERIAAAPKLTTH